MMRLDILCRKAIDTITLLRREKEELSQRVQQLDELVEQERSNSKQRDKLFASSKSEREQHAAELTALLAKREEQESLLLEQLEVIAKLEDEVTLLAKRLDEKEAEERSRMERVEASALGLQSLEEKLAEVQHERDELRAKVYGLEREAAGWALTFTKEEAKQASHAVDTILSRIDKVEKRSARLRKNGSAVDTDTEDIFENT